MIIRTIFLLGLILTSVFGKDSSSGSGESSREKSRKRESDEVYENAKTEVKAEIEGPFEMETVAQIEAESPGKNEIGEPLAVKKIIQMLEDEPTTEPPRPRLAPQIKHKPTEPTKQLIASEMKMKPKQQLKPKSYHKFPGIDGLYKLPFIVRLVNPLEVGQTVHTSGTIDPIAKRIDMAFHIGSSSNSDMPLHISARFDEGPPGGKLVLRTFENGTWSSEQALRNPFKRGGDFDVRIRIIDGKFKIFANNVEVSSIDQTMPLDKIDHVSVKGDLAKLSLFHYGGAVFENPYIAIVQLVPQKRLDISAIPTGENFNVNLKRADRDHALQLSFRLNERIIVRNAKVNGDWGTEEKFGTLPIKKGELFDLTIVNEGNVFQIFINGKRFTSFTHRGNAHDIETLRVDGDVELHTVTVNDAIDISSQEEETRMTAAPKTAEKTFKRYPGEMIYKIPLNMQLGGSIKDGQTIHTVGILKPNPKRIDFNFQQGTSPSSDMPIHIAIVFDKGSPNSKLIYNTFENGNWSVEEHTVASPFKPSKEFDLRIRINGEKYQIFANGQHVGTFEQKMPLDRIDRASINGDVSSIRLFRYGGGLFPIPYRAIAKLIPHKRLDISAIPTGNNTIINLYNANHEIPMQLSIRLNQGVMVRNAKMNGAWGKEEKGGKLPIKKDKLFDLTVINEEDGFHIYINGKQFGIFKHRGDPYDIEKMEINGDAEIHTVSISDALDDLTEQQPPQEKPKKYKKFVNETIHELPFNVWLTDPLKNGQTVHTGGTIKQSPKRVDFNFQCGPSASDDKLHISMRFDEGSPNGKLVYNAFKNGSWSTNEKKIKNPFKPNSEFDLRLRVLDGKYQIYANRVLVASFDQEIPFEEIDHVVIKGDISNLTLFHYGGRVHENPFTAKSNLIPGQRLDISAIPNGDNIDINLYRYDQEHALQLSIRLKEGVVVRNAKVNGVWGKEEKAGKLPIKKGQLFDCTIINEDNGFLILFNGKYFGRFAHRGHPLDVETMEISGDVDIHAVTINDAVLV